MEISSRALKANNGLGKGRGDGSAVRVLEDKARHVEGEAVDLAGMVADAVRV